ncbi:unnamed protein product, partial [marine sediment metagenome]
LVEGDMPPVILEMRFSNTLSRVLNRTPNSLAKLFPGYEALLRGVIARNQTISEGDMAIAPCAQQKLRF